MINADHTTPEVPSSLGEENAVLFTRAGQEYRIVLVEPEVWVIHRRDVARESFEIVLENPDQKRRTFDATIRSGAFSSSAIGHSLSFVISQFC